MLAVIRHDLLQKNVWFLFLFFNRLTALIGNNSRIMPNQIFQFHSFIEAFFSFLVVSHWHFWLNAPAPKWEIKWEIQNEKLKTWSSLKRCIQESVTLNQFCLFLVSVCFHQSHHLCANRIKSLYAWSNLVNIWIVLSCMSNHYPKIKQICLSGLEPPWSLLFAMFDHENDDRCIRLYAVQIGELKWNYAL